MYVKGTMRTIIALSLLFVLSSNISAFKIDVEGNYSSNDVLVPGDQNIYYIDLKDEDVVKWSLIVDGNGTVQIFFLEEHKPTFNWVMDEFDVQHSSFDDKKEYSDELSASSRTGYKFTILVQTNENENVTYHMKIDVDHSTKPEKSISDYVVEIFISIGTIVLVLGYFFRRRISCSLGDLLIKLGKKEVRKREETKRAIHKAWYQKDPPSFTCPSCKKALDFNDMTKKWYCPLCGKTI